MLSPTVFLGVLLAGTIVVLLIHAAAVRIHQRRLIKLAREWRMHYAADDRFDLAPRVAERLPLPGAADVRVVDLIYGMEGGTRRYVFSAHYTQGIVRGKRRESCVASLSEKPTHDGGEWSSIQIASTELSLVEQYHSLNDRAPKKAGQTPEIPDAVARKSKKDLVD